MNINKILIDKIENLVKLSSDFDSGFKIIYDIPSNKIDNVNSEILYSLTKNYIEMRKIHGELLLIMNKLLNSNNLDLDLDYNLNGDEKLNKKNLKKNISDDTIENSNTKILKPLYDISTFSSLLNNANELINNIDFEYKKIALKYPKFINKKPINCILITDGKNDKYIQMIEKLKIDYPENIYKIIYCKNNEDKIKCNEELKELDIKIKMNSLPLIYIINGSNIIEIPINKIDNIEHIKNLIE